MCGPAAVRTVSVRRRWVRTASLGLVRANQRPEHRSNDIM
jgi:hypothetical protein